MAPQGGADLQRALDDAAHHLDACSTRIQRLLDESGVTCGVPRDVRSAAGWCRGQSFDVGLRLRLLSMPLAGGEARLTTTVGSTSLLPGATSHRTCGWPALLTPGLGGAALVTPGAGGGGGERWPGIRHSRPIVPSTVDRPEPATGVGALHIDAESEAQDDVVVAPRKLDYLFGAVDSGAHNADRSRQNLDQLQRIGIPDSPAGRAVVAEHLEAVGRDQSSVEHTFSNQYGSFEVRESLLSGPRGAVKLESTWETMPDGSARLTTVIPYGGG